MKNREKTSFKNRSGNGNEEEMRRLLKAAVFGVTLLALTIIGLALLSVAAKLLFDFVEKYWLFVFIAMAGALITFSYTPRKTYRPKRRPERAKSAGGEY